MASETTIGMTMHSPKIPAAIGHERSAVVVGIYHYTACKCQPGQLELMEPTAVPRNAGTEPSLVLEGRPGSVVPS